MEVEFADEVRFSPPLLEEIGANLNVERNEEILTVSVPSLQRIGGRLTFYGNPSNTPDVSDTVRNAFAQVVIPDGVIICSNGPDDFCPWDERCWEVFDSDYCCPVNMGSEECISSRPWGE